MPLQFFKFRELPLLFLYLEPCHYYFISTRLVPFYTLDAALGPHADRTRRILLLWRLKPSRDDVPSRTSGAVPQTIRPWLAQLSWSVLTGTLAPPLFDPTNPRPAAVAEQRRRKTSKEVRCRRLEADGEPPLDGTSPTGGADGGRWRGQQRRAQQVSLDLFPKPN